MRKLSKWTRLPQIPELNKPPLMVNLTILGLVCVFFYMLVFSDTKTPLWAIPFLAYHFLLEYAPRKMIAQDLFLKNLIEFKGKIIEFYDERQVHPALTSIKIETSEPIQQNVDQNFLILTPCDLNTTIFARLKNSSKSLVTTFPLDHFLQQEVIFRSFQQSAFIFDLGFMLKDQAGQEIQLFFKQLEYTDQQGEKHILKYKNIHKVQHHFDFREKIHHFKLKFRKTEISFNCDQNQFFAIRQLLTASHIHFL